MRGQVQREGAVIHIIAHRLDDVSPLLVSVGNRAHVSDVYRVSRADVPKSPASPDPRDPETKILGEAAGEIYIADLRLGSRTVPGKPTAGMEVKPRDSMKNPDREA